MTESDDLRAKLAREEEALDRINQRLAELRRLLGTTTGDPAATPDEWRAELAQLHAERYAAARDINVTRHTLGVLEQRTRYLQSRVDACNAEIARLEAVPPTTPDAATLIREQIVYEQRIRDSLQITLDAIVLRDMEMAV